MSRAYVVAVTGGVASGKSTVCDALAARGVPVIDADQVARELVAPGEPALAEIVAAFGAQALAPDGTLDRAAMRRRIFADETARRRLEAILHPRVRERMAELARAVAAPYCVLAIPLLAETGRYPFVDCVVVVDVDPAVQRERVMRRDGVGAELAERMIAAQAPRATRLALADLVVDNSGSVTDLAGRIETLHAELLRRAAARSRGG